MYEVFKGGSDEIFEEGSEEKFQRFMKGIREHYSRPEVHLSSHVETDFKAYHQLVELGTYALKPLRKLIGRETEPRWYILMASCEILRSSGVKVEFSDDIKGNLGKMEKQVSATLDDVLGS
jgi:hypothetical protein